MPLPAPDLHIPPSASTVEVSIIHTTSRIRGLHAAQFMAPNIKGCDEIDCTVFCFLVHNPALNRSLLFDLGIRKDWQNLPAPMVAAFEKFGIRLDVEKNAHEILAENGFFAGGGKIEAVIWSHPHFDHTGDVATFGTETSLVVGPGFKETCLGPNGPKSMFTGIIDSDLRGRELQEISFDDKSAKIGRFDTFDYFGDGSFYLLHTPGHTPDHLCGIARVTSSPDSFIFIGGDVAHHAGELRPSQYMPLPKEISPHPFTDSADDVCLGSLFDALLGVQFGSEKPFFELARGPMSAHDDVDVGHESIAKVQEADAGDNVLVVLAHDHSLLNVVDLYPQKANDFMAKGWNLKARWRFLKDFVQAVDYEGPVNDF